MTGGLGDRMQVLDSAFSLARDLDTFVVVPWLINSGMGARFDQLFEMDKLNRHKILYFDSLDKMKEYISSTNPSIVFDRLKISWSLESSFEFRNKFVDLDRLRSYPVIAIRSYERFYNNKSKFEDFIPRHYLQEKIDGVVAVFSNTVGVHIRRTDNKRAIRDSKTEYFAKLMNILHKTVDNFFVATDDYREEQLLADCGFNILSYSKRSLDRSTVEAIEDAVIDLYCLSATKQLIGSHNSSFTFVAGRLRDIPIIKAGVRSSTTWEGW